MQEMECSGGWLTDAREAPGDAAAFARLVERFERMAYANAYARLSDRWLAQDATQEALVEVYLHLDELRDPRAFPAWLARIVAKHCDRITRRPQFARASFAAAERLAHREAQTAKDARTTVLLEALETLPPAQRQAVSLAYLAGIDQPTIAALLGIPHSAVKARLRRARERMRRILMTTPAESTNSLPLRPERPVAKLFHLLRSGDAHAVAELIAGNPALARAEEDWDEDEGARYRLGLARHGTPLIRAIERDDLAMVDTILAAGGDVGQVCGCDAAEPPLWTAAVHGRLAHVDRLLAAGADPNVAAFRGATPLHVASMRGDTAIVDRLIAAGARSMPDHNGRTPADWSEMLPRPITPRASANDGIIETGIKAIDVFAPFAVGGMVRIMNQVSVGSTVLLAELAIRFSRHLGQPVTWTGFPQRPADAGDVAHALAETGAAADVGLHLVPLDLEPESRRLRLREAVEAALAQGGLLVLFEEAGYMADSESVYGLLADPSVLSLVVSPLVRGPEVADGSQPPFTGSLSFDTAMAKRGRFPAVDVRRSFSRGGTSQVAERARAVTAGAIDRLEKSLVQPFFCAEPFTGVPGTWIDRAHAEAAVTAAITSSARSSE